MADDTVYSLSSLRRETTRVGQLIGEGRRRKGYTLPRAVDASVDERLDTLRPPVTSNLGGHVLRQKESSGQQIGN